MEENSTKTKHNCIFNSLKTALPLASSALDYCSLLGSSSPCVCFSKQFLMPNMLIFLAKSILNKKHHKVCAYVCVCVGRREC